MQSSPLPSSPPFMSGVCSSIFQSALPKVPSSRRALIITREAAGFGECGNRTHDL
ncbi:hypothetical protein [Treponema endosymbiont of Eucomonympha sp.]|uniref:hypothetical protein n=1 Tax=Treponema endosymbiont of Eucomonympha sp. TaxID=1580831 RepID=UPI001650313E|nr:hypothetical protein [Treponema endosymbiont of Eucomonympha sp.]